MKIKKLTQLTNLKLALIIVFLTANSVGCFAQKQKTVPPPITWGEIDKSSFDKSVAEAFADASTITLCKFGQIYVSYSEVEGYVTHTDVHVRFLVMSKEGISRSNIRIPFYSGEKNATIKRDRKNKFYGTETAEYVENIRGSVYNLDDNGSVITSKLNDDQMFAVDLSDIYSVGVVSLALPDVKEGSVVEYSYTISQKYTMQFERWYFQSEYPCLHNECRVSYPDKMSFAIITKGLLKDSIDISESMLTFVNIGGRLDKVYKYLLEDVPALHDEPFVMTMKNFKTQLRIQISEYHDVRTQSNVKVISTWKLLSDKLWFSDHFGRKLNRNIANYIDLHELYDPSLDSSTIIKNCFNHVRNHFHCNESEHLFIKNNLKDTYKSTVGSSAEINFVLAGLLIKAGFKPRMALVSTRDHGFVNVHYPFIDQFNHVVCVIENKGKKMFLDASYKQGAYNSPPAKIIECTAFIIDKKNPELVKITTDHIFEKFVMCSGKLENDTLVGKLQFKYKGYAAALERMDINNSGDDYRYDLVDNSEDIELINQKIINLEDNDKPLLTQFDYSVEAEGFGSSDLYYFNPFSVYGNFENPFKSKERSFPIEFNYLYSITYMYSYIIPDGYEILDIPEGISKTTYDNSTSILIYYNVVGKIIQIKTQLKINKLVIPSMDYQYIRDIFSLWETKHEDVIVLKKKQE